MERERWHQLEQVCQAALDHAGSERAAFLEAACAGDEALRRDAEALLAMRSKQRSTWRSPPLAGRLGADPNRIDAAGALEAGRFLQSLPEPDSPTTEATADEPGPNASGPGRCIGHYHLLQKIGEGGMGEVWLAEQKEPVRRRVALKLVKAGMDTREVVARFESERQALALMDHPAIAKVFDAGSTPQGAPYFVMEYVAGVPITAYCDNHRLSTRERLELFMHVCEGVQHAHQKAIIHRDLKPSNILVTEVDGQRGAEDHRFRRGQGADAEADGRHDVHARGGAGRNSGIHEPGAGALVGRGYRHAHGCLLAGRHFLRVAGGRAAARAAQNRL